MRLVTAWTIVVMLGAEGARAQGTTTPPARCDGPSIVLEPALRRHRSWAEAAGDARRRVAELPDIDQCTRLEVTQTQAAFRVRASVADGRSVVRELAGPGELEPTVVALLVLPPPERAEERATSTTHGTSTPDAAPEVAPSAKPTPPRPPPRAPLVTSRVDAHDGTAGAARLGASSRSGFELALGGSGRAAGSLLGAGASTVLDWRLGGWLLGATVHGEAVKASSSSESGFSSEESGTFGALVGRRLVTRPFYLDVALEAPLLSLRSSHYTASQVVQETVPPANPDDDTNEPGSDDPSAMPTTTSRTVSSRRTVGPAPDLRAGVLVRGVVPFSGHFGATLSADAEHTLGILKVKRVAGQPAPLGWSLGVSLGLFWSGG